MAKSSMKSFDKVISMELKESEELLWRGAPQKAAFVLSRSVQYLPLALIWMSFDGFALFMIFNAGIPDEIKSYVNLFLIGFLAVHLLPVWIWIFSVIKSFKSQKDFEYVFTNERIIVREKDKLQSYYYKQIDGVGVSVTLIDRLFKVGDLNLNVICLPIENIRNPSFRSVTLQDIKTPYVICEKLKQFVEAHEEERNALTKQPNKDDVYASRYKYGNVRSYNRNEGKFTSKKSSAPSDKN